MNGPRTLHHEFPLFTGPSPVPPSRVWDALDDVTRRQVVERVAALLLAHAEAHTRASSLPPAPQFME
jgi:hypothetical protein